MSLEEFEKYINRIKAINEFQDKLYGVCSVFNQSNKMGEEAVIWMPTMATSVVELLEIAIGSNSDWISYWIWELDYGEKYKDGWITDENGNNIKMKTVEDLYNFLINIRPAYYG